MQDNLKYEQKTQSLLRNTKFFQEGFVYSTTQDVGCYECLRIRPKSESTHHIRGAACDCPSYGFRKFCGHLDVLDKSERITLDKKGIFPLFALKVLGEVLDPLYNEFCYKSMEEDWLRISEFLKTAPEEKRIHGISLTVLPPSPIKLIHIWLAQKNWDLYIRFS